FDAHGGVLTGYVNEGVHLTEPGQRIKGPESGLGAASLTLSQETENNARIATEIGYLSVAAAACVTVNRYMFRFRSDHCYDSFNSLHTVTVRGICPFKSTSTLFKETSNV